MHLYMSSHSAEKTQSGSIETFQHLYYIFSNASHHQLALSEQQNEQQHRTFEVQLKISYVAAFQIMSTIHSFDVDALWK